MKLHLLAVLVIFILGAQCTSSDACNDEDDAVALLQPLPRQGITSSRDIPVSELQYGLGSESSSANVDAGEGDMFEANPVIPRPNAGTGPDEVRYGIIVKDFYNANLYKQTFTVDIVITFKWKDTRAISAIPSNLDNVTLSSDQAAAFIWMPEVDVTDRDVGAAEDISTSVIVFKSGMVQKFQRQVVRVKHKFVLGNYPVDTQEMSIRIASTKYLASSLVLIPLADPTLSGITSSMFGEYDLKSWRQHSFNETDGHLVKSRGQLSFKIKHRAWAYIQDHLLPSVLVLGLSCAGFSLPLGKPFIQPRVFVSVLMILAFMSLVAHSESGLPLGSPSTWNTVINENLMMLVLINAGVNIFIEVVSHSWGLEELAERINFEAKAVTLLLLVFVGLWLWFATFHHDLLPGDTHGRHAFAHAVAKLIAFVIVVPWLIYKYNQVRQMVGKARRDPNVV